MAPSSFLLTHFDRLAEAPGGVAKLRALLLQLGVQGKLTQRDLADTPATKIISHFRRPKAPFAPISDDELPFQIPATWVWSRLGACMELFNGRAFKPTDWSAQGLPIIRIKNLNDETAPFNHCAFGVDNRHLIKDDDFLISWSGTPGTSFGAFIWKRGKAVLNQHIFRAELSSPELYKPFMRLAVNSRLDELISKAHGGVGLQHVTKPTLEHLPLPIPPLAEQRRIVAKVEELMGLCDALEVAQRERETVRTRLRTSALHQLASPDSDSKSAPFVLQNLPRLIATREDFAPLRQSILQFAITGRFSRNLSGWRECKLGEILIYGPKNGVSPKASSVPTKTKSLSLSATTSGVFKGEYFKYVDLEPEEDSELWLCDGDILIQRSNTREYVGTAAIYRGEPNSFIYPDLMMRLRVAATVDVDYIHRVLSAPATRAYFSSAASGSSETMPKINQEAVRNTPIPLPPLAEQRRIVAKVDELMAVLDALEAALTTARATAASLLAATVAGLHAA